MILWQEAPDTCDPPDAILRIVRVPSTFSRETYQVTGFAEYPAAGEVCQTGAILRPVSC